MRLIAMPPGIETWKSINGYEGLYEISNLGRCKSLEKITNFGNRKKIYPETILKPKTRKGLYSSYVLCNSSGPRTHMIHRLVAIHFIPNRLNKIAVNHKDGNKRNNDVNNLEWVTHSENILHALDNGLMKTRKLTKEDIIEIRTSKLSDIQLAKIFGVSKGNIWNIQTYKSWKHVQ